MKNSIRINLYCSVAFIISIFMASLSSRYSSEVPLDTIEISKIALNNEKVAGSFVVLKSGRGRATYFKTEFRSFEILYSGFDHELKNKLNESIFYGIVADDKLIAVTTVRNELLYVEPPSGKSPGGVMQVLAFILAVGSLTLIAANWLATISQSLAGHKK